MANTPKLFAMAPFVLHRLITPSELRITRQSVGTRRADPLIIRSPASHLPWTRRKTWYSSKRLFRSVW
jgi:hypothetical protein